MPSNSFSFFILLMSGIALSSCNSTSLNKRYYSDQYTKKLSKYNGAGKLLKRYKKIVVKTYNSHNTKSYEDGFYWTADHPVNFQEYKLFMDYCRDSIARMLVGYIYNFNGNVFTDWSRPLEWTDRNFVDRLDVITTPYPIRPWFGITVNYDKIDYEGDTTFPSVRSCVMPDTTHCCRINPGTAMIFGDEARSFPVNGITYMQAEAYCNWLTSIWNNTLERKQSEQRLLVSLYETKDSSLLKRMYSGFKTENYSSTSCVNAAPAFFLKENQEKAPAITCNYLLWIKISLVKN